MMDRITRTLILALAAPLAVWTQPKNVPPPAPLPLEQPDAQRTRQELSDLLQRYPPNLRQVLALDPSLLSNQSYLAPYPALAGFLNTHPEVLRSPSFYVGAPEPPRADNSAVEMAQKWESMLEDVTILAGFSLAICLIAWLIRTFIDARRWNRLATVQTEAHNKLLDRFTNNEDLLAYVQSPAGAKFLQSSPIMLDAAPKSMAAPLSRILWTVQGGVVLMAGGIGLQLIAGRVSYEAAEPLRGLGILGVALGLGLVISAIISFMIARRLGLIEHTPGIARITPQE
jgi:hypothetical protein